jgi:hypothetical protein
MMNTKGRLAGIIAHPSVTDRCKALEEYLSDPRADYKELLIFFPQLLGHVFGEQKKGGWLGECIKNISGPSSDLQHLVQLLHPNGKLFQQFILKYSSTSSFADMSFPWPVSRIPV